MQNNGNKKKTQSRTKDQQTNKTQIIKLKTHHWPTNPESLQVSLWISINQIQIPSEGVPSSPGVETKRGITQKNSIRHSNGEWYLSLSLLSSGSLGLSESSEIETERPDICPHKHALLYF